MRAARLGTLLSVCFIVRHARSTTYGLQQAEHTEHTEYGAGIQDKMFFPENISPRFNHNKRTKNCPTPSPPKYPGPEYITLQQCHAICMNQAEKPENVILMQPPPPNRPPAAPNQNQAFPQKPPVQHQFPQRPPDLQWITQGPLNSQPIEEQPLDQQFIQQESAEQTISSDPLNPQYFTDETQVQQPFLQRPPSLQTQESTLPQLIDQPVQHQFPQQPPGLQWISQETLNHQPIDEQPSDQQFTQQESGQQTISPDPPNQQPLIEKQPTKGQHPFSPQPPSLQWITQEPLNPQHIDKYPPAQQFTQQESTSQIISHDPPNQHPFAEEQQVQQPFPQQPSSLQTITQQFTLPQIIGQQPADEPFTQQSSATILSEPLNQQHFSEDSLGQRPFPQRPPDLQINSQEYPFPQFIGQQPPELQFTQQAPAQQFIPAKPLNQQTFAEESQGQSPFPQRPPSV